MFYWDSNSNATADNGIIVRPSSNPLTGRWIRIYNGDINLKWFGAYGNGFDDDTVAIQNWVAALSNHWVLGTKGYVPAGKYITMNRIEIASEEAFIHIYGDGMYQSMFKLAKVTPDTCLYIGSNEVVSTNIIIEDIGISTPTNNADGSRGIQLVNRGNVKLNRILVNGCYTGIEVSSGGWAFRLNDSLIANNKYLGIIFGNDFSANNAVITNNSIIGNGKDTAGCGIYIPNGFNILIQGNDIEGENYAGIVIGGADSVNIDSNYIENQLSTNIYFNNLCHNVNIVNNWLGACPNQVWGNINGGNIKNNSFYHFNVSLDPNSTDVTVGINNFMELATPFYSTWTAPPALENNWVNQGGYWETVGYRKTADGLIVLKGQIMNGTVGARVFTLPTGYRPLGNMTFACAGTSGIGQVTVLVTGEVIINLAPGNQISLNNVIFTLGR